MAAKQTKVRLNSLMREHFRGIIWPRDTRKAVDGSTVYRYTVIGLLVTDTPIDEFEGYTDNLGIPGQIPLDGSSPGMAEVLRNVRIGKLKYNPGDAGDVLVGLSDLFEDPE